MAHPIHRICILAALFVGGCGASIPPDVTIEDIRVQWNANIKKLGVSYVVYPPTEDIQVGDVYVFDNRSPDEWKAAGEKAKSPTRRVDRVDLREQLKATYRARITLPKTASAVTDGYRPQQTDDTVFRRDADTDRASVMAMVGLDLAAVSVRSAGLSLPLSIFGISASGSQQGSSTVRVRASAVETYGLVDYPALQALRDYCRGSRKGIAGLNEPCDASRVADLLLAMDGNRSCKTGIFVVTRVILVRQIDYILERDGGYAVGADVAVTLTKALEAQKQIADLIKQSGAQTSDGTPSLPAAGGKTVETTPALEQLKSQNAELAKSLAGLQSRLVPGGTFSISEANSAQIRLSQVFERPLAIAYDGPAFDTVGQDRCDPKKAKVEW